MSEVRITDRDGCTWRPHPLVAVEWQIRLPGTDTWSDADLLPDDGPFVGVCDLIPCRICPVNATYDELPELVRLMSHQ